MSDVDRHASGVASLDKNALYRFVKDVAENFRYINTRIGGAQPQFADNPLLAQKVAVPPPATYLVTGLDGKFIATITNPQSVNPLSPAVAMQRIKNGINAATTPMYHNLQSAGDINFNQGSPTTDRGISQQLSYIFQEPNLTRFWRLRSSYDGVNWNNYQIFEQPGVSGPVGVYSGLLRNSASDIVDSAATSGNASAVSQNALLTDILVAATTWKCGDQTISYNSGHVDPSAYGKYYIYASDPKRVGGTVTFIASLQNPDVSAALGLIFFGFLTTAAGGGGTGHGGGGGGCCRGGVAYRKFNGEDVNCALLRKGDELLGVDGGKEIIERIELHPKRACFRLIFDVSGKLVEKSYIGDFTVYQLHLDRSHTFYCGKDGIIDGASSDHPIQYAGGGFRKVFDCVVGEKFNLIDGRVGSHNANKN